MNSKNSEASDLHRLLVSLTEKINLKESDKYVSLLLTYNGKIHKSHTKIINLKYQRGNGVKSWITKRPDGSYFISDNRDYFEYILKNMERKKLIILR